jgi:hypothetical protein
MRDCLVYGGKAEKLATTLNSTATLTALLPALPTGQMSATILLTLYCCLGVSLYLLTNHVINSGSTAPRISARLPLYNGT